MLSEHSPPTSRQRSVYIFGLVRKICGYSQAYDLRLPTRAVNNPDRMELQYYL